MGNKIEVKSGERKVRATSQIRVSRIKQPIPNRHHRNDKKNTRDITMMITYHIHIHSRPCLFIFLLRVVRQLSASIIKTCLVPLGEWRRGDVTVSFIIGNYSKNAPNKDPFVGKKLFRRRAMFMYRKEDLKNKYYIFFSSPLRCYEFYVHAFSVNA